MAGVSQLYSLDEQNINYTAVGIAGAGWEADTKVAILFQLRTSNLCVTSKEEGKKTRKEIEPASK